MQRILTGVFLLMFVFTAWPVFSEEIIEVSIRDIHPTQPGAGFASSEASRLKKFKDIKDESGLRAKLKSEPPLRAVRGPGGGIFLTDGHHRALGAFRTSSAVCTSARPTDGVDSCMKGARIRVRLEGDYSTNTWNEFVDALQKQNNIYLPPVVRDKLKSGEISKEAIFREPDGIIPPTLGKLVNDSMRSALGSLLVRPVIALNTDNFVNYFEFFLAERVEKRVKFEPGHETDLEVSKSIANIIFNDPEIVLYMRCLARTDGDNWQKAQSQINRLMKLAPETPFEQAACKGGK